MQTLLTRLFLCSITPMFAALFTITELRETIALPDSPQELSTLIIPPWPCEQMRPEDYPMGLRPRPSLVDILMFPPLMWLVPMQRSSQADADETLGPKIRPQACESQQAVPSTSPPFYRWMLVLILYDPACLGPKLLEARQADARGALLDMGQAGTAT